MDNDHALHRDNFHHEDAPNPPKNPFRPDAIVEKVAPHIRELITRPLSQNSILPLTYRQSLGGRPRLDFNLNFSIDAWSLLVGGYGASALGFYLEDYYEGLDFNYEPTENDINFFLTWPFSGIWPHIFHCCHTTLIFCGRFAGRFVGGGLIYCGSGLAINYVFDKKWGAVTSAAAGAITGAFLSRNKGYATIFRVTTGFAFYASIMEFIFGLFVFSFSDRFER